MDSLRAMVDALKTKLVFGLELKGSEEAAIAYVRPQTTAGTKAWSTALSELGWRPLAD